MCNILRNTCTPIALYIHVYDGYCIIELQKAGSYNNSVTVLLLLLIVYYLVYILLNT